MFVFRFTIRPDKIEDNPVLKSPTHLINNIPFHIKIDVSEQVTFYKENNSTNRELECNK